MAYMDGTMDEGECACALAELIDKFIPGWDANGLDMGEVHLTTELGDKFVLVFEKVEEFP